MFHVRDPPHFLFFINGLSGLIYLEPEFIPLLLHRLDSGTFSFLFHSLPRKRRFSTPTCAGAYWSFRGLALKFKAVACCSLRVDLCLDSGHESNQIFLLVRGLNREGNGNTRFLALSLRLNFRTERSFRNARPICFVAAKDEFDPLGSSICSEKKRETRKHL